MRQRESSRGGTYYISLTQNYRHSWLARKGRKGDLNESRSRLGYAILLSRCYFAIARLKRGNIVEPGWFLWHRKENLPRGAHNENIIILSNVKNSISHASFERHFRIPWHFVGDRFREIRCADFLYLCHDSIITDTTIDMSNLYMYIFPTRVF